MGNKRNQLGEFIRLIFLDQVCLCHAHLLKCTKQNVDNQILTQVSQPYAHVSICLILITS